MVATGKTGRALVVTYFKAILLGSSVFNPGRCIAELSCTAAPKSLETRKCKCHDDLAHACRVWQTRNRILAFRFEVALAHVRSRAVLVINGAFAVDYDQLEQPLYRL